MKRVVEYKVVSGTTEMVVAEVNRMLKDGWQPLGGMQNADRASVEPVWRGQQTMVKYEDLVLE